MSSTENLLGCLQIRPHLEQRSKLGVSVLLLSVFATDMSPDISPTPFRLRAAPAQRCSARSSDSCCTCACVCCWTKSSVRSDTAALRHTRGPRETRCQVFQEGFGEAYGGESSQSNETAYRKRYR